VTRFVVDSSAVLRLVSGPSDVHEDHELLAPTLLRSQTLSALYEAVRRGELTTEDAHERLDRVRRLPIRLLGDAVLRRRAWDVAARLGWATTYDAEYVALTQLQADALITLNQEFAAAVKGLVTVAPYEELISDAVEKHLTPRAKVASRLDEDGDAAQETA